MRARTLSYYYRIQVTDICHPDIYNVGANVLLADRGERMAQAVSRFSCE